LWSPAVYFGSIHHTRTNTGGTISADAVFSSGSRAFGSEQVSTMCYSGD
jgi:hypothetical protein